jgi:hypothetical protein
MLYPIELGVLVGLNLLRERTYGFPNGPWQGITVKALTPNLKRPDSTNIDTGPSIVAKKLGRRNRRHSKGFVYRADRSELPPRSRTARSAAAGREAAAAERDSSASNRFFINSPSGAE